MQSLTLNQITSTIKSIKKFPIFKLNTNKFLQSYDIPENFVMEADASDISLIETSNNNNNSFVYEQNEILEVPSYFCDFLDLNKYYIFGCGNYIESILYILDSEYKMKNSSDKLSVIGDFKSILLENLNSSYKKFNYLTEGLKKAVIKNSLENVEFDYSVLRYISDFMCINILLINIENKKFSDFKCSSVDSSEIKNNIILLKYKNHILPLIHICGEEFTYKDLQKIKLNFSEFKTLNKITSYTMSDLIDIANKNNISIYSDNINSKKKLKQQLYNDIKSFFEN